MKHALRSGHVALALGAVLIALAACGGGEAARTPVDGVVDQQPIPDEQAIPAGEPSSVVRPEDADTAGTDRSAPRLEAGGPGGASNANLWADVLDADEVVRSVTVCAGGFVDSVQLTTSKRTFPRRGGPGGTCRTVSLNAGEQIRQVFGTAFSAVDSIGFVTTQGRRIGPFGNPSGGAAFTMTVFGGADAKFLGWRGVTGIESGALVITQISVLQQGMGGAGGRPFADRLQADESVSRVRTCWRPSGYVMSVQLFTNLGARRFHGGSAADQQCADFNLDAGEFIVELVGRAGGFVDAVGYVTNRGRRSPVYGGPGGEGFSQSLGNPRRFYGLFGASGAWMDRIGLVEPIVGGDTGNLFEDVLPPGQRVNAVEICTGPGVYTGNQVRSVQAFHDGTTGLSRHGAGAGAVGLTCSRLDFNDGEFVTAISGGAGAIIDWLQFSTNQGRRFGPFGLTSGGNTFTIENPWNAFLGFRGRSTQTGVDGGSIVAIDFAGPDSLPSASPPGAGAATQGWWSGLGEWPLIGLHAAVMTDGRVMSYGTDASAEQGSQFIFDVWDPRAGLGAASHLTLPNTLGTDMFCSGQSLMPNGRLLFAGGDARDNGYNRGIRNSTVFDAAVNRLEPTALLNQARWYASQKVLHNGNVLVLGGINESGQASLTPEVYDGTAWRLLTGINTSVLGNNYPRAFATTSTQGAQGRAVWVIATRGDRAFNGRIYRLDVGANGGQGQLVDSGVRLPEFHSWDRPVAQISPTQVLVMLDSGNTVIVNLPNTGSAADRPSIEPAGNVSQPRAWAEMVLLPNGQVLASGGSRAANQLLDVAYHAELWNPATRTWSRVASQLRPRLYHSTALLLADGRVLAMGGGAPSPTVELNAQLYSPPYLFDSAGGARVRPTFSIGSTSLAFGSTATLAVGGAPTRATLLRLGATTHSYNSEQMHAVLPVLGNRGGSMTVRMPGAAGAFTPGYYYLSVVDAQGVPSASTIVMLR